MLADFAYEDYKNSKNCACGHKKINQCTWYHTKVDPINSGVTKNLQLPILDLLDTTKDVQNMLPECRRLKDGRNQSFFE